MKALASARTDHRAARQPAPRPRTVAEVSLSDDRPALVGGRCARCSGADYVANADNEIVLMAMIETKEGLANLDAICATKGLDAVYIGPADLSFALGMAPRGDNPDPVHMATCDKIRDAAHKHGIKCVMHCASAAFAAGAVKRGFDMVMRRRTSPR